MTRVYLLSCRDVGVDCDFEARGSSLEEVMQRSAEHGSAQHNMMSFGPELYLKMHRGVRLLDAQEAPTPVAPRSDASAGSHPLDVTRERVGAIDVVHVAGRLDNTTAELFDARMREAETAQGTRLVLDLAKVTYVSSAGLRSLLVLLKQVNGLGGALVLAAIQPRVQDVLDIAGFAAAFTMTPTLDAGLARLQRDR